MALRNLAGKRVLLTGASSGIGACLARALVQKRARVHLVARNLSRLQALCAELAALGPPPLITAGDVTDASVLAQALLQSQQSWGGLDILINNAGVGAIARFTDLSAEEFDRVLAVNFQAPVAWIRGSLNLLQRGEQPLVVVVGSILGHRGIPQYTAYCASKFALRGFCEALRSELRSAGIGLLEVDPGRTATEFSQHLLRQDAVIAPRWRGIPPHVVADRIVRAMERGTRRIVPSLSGRMLVWASRLSPRLVDWFVERSL